LPPDPLILAFDTSAAHCAAALFSGDAVVAAATEEMAKGQAERLFPLLEALLAQAGADWRDLTALAVGVGPGNFTGVRIAVAAARGLALARSIPAHGVTTFEALAHGLPRPVVASVDARQGRVYLQAFAPEPAAPLIADLTLLPPALPARVVGHRAEEIAAATGGEALAPALPLAEAMARIAAARPVPQARPAPLYLRPADALPAREPPPVILDA
jgi:tRNA threonylcarbamoyladenosine biosynthesis protein TsaB